MCTSASGPSHCARCVEGACGKGACVQASLGFELGGAAGDKTPEELTADPVFTGGLKRSIAEACDFAALGLSEDNIKDLVISYGRRRLEVEQLEDERDLAGARRVVVDLDEADAALRVCGADCEANEPVGREGVGGHRDVALGLGGVERGVGAAEEGARGLGRAAALRRT